MSWRAITEADLLTRISGPELASIRAAALGVAQADPIQATIDQVTLEVRGRVAACRNNELGAGDTIPDELLSHALAMIVVALMPRAAGLMIDGNGARKEAAERADRVLKDVARCEFAIEQPSSVSSQVISSPSPSICANTRTVTRETTDGM
jgi:hypothetical protein